MKAKYFTFLISIVCVAGSAISCSSTSEPTTSDQKQMEQTQANSPDIDASKG